MDNGGRRGIRHHPCRFTDRGRLDTGDAISPFRGGAAHVLSQGIKPVGVLLNILLIESLLIDDHVDPGKQEGQVGGRTDGQPVLRFTGDCGETRIDGDDGRTFVNGIRHLLHLAVVHILAQVGSQQYQTAGVANIRRFGRAQAGSVGRHKGYFPWSTTLCKGRRSNIDRTHRLQQLPKMISGRTVIEERDALRTILIGYLPEFGSHQIQGLLPACLTESLSFLSLHSDQWTLEPVIIKIHSDASGTPRT